MGEWYVSFVNAHDVETHVASDRAAAINEACELLKQGIEVTGVGPATESPGAALDAEVLLEIFERRGRVGRLPL